MTSVNNTSCSQTLALLVARNRGESIGYLKSDRNKNLFLYNKRDPSIESKNFDSRLSIIFRQTTRALNNIPAEEAPQVDEILGALKSVKQMYAHWREKVKARCWIVRIFIHLAEVFSGRPSISSSYKQLTQKLQSLLDSVAEADSHKNNDILVKTEESPDTDVETDSESNSPITDISHSRVVREKEEKSAPVTFPEELKVNAFSKKNKEKTDTLLPKNLSGESSTSQEIPELARFDFLPKQDRLEQLDAKDYFSLAEFSKDLEPAKFVQVTKATQKDISIQAMAEKGLKKIKKTDIVSYNYLSRHRHLYTPTPSWDVAYNEIRKLRDEINSKFENDFENALSTAEEVKKRSIGNCWEMCRYAFFYLLERVNPSTKIDIYNIIDGDHVFLVLGRDVKSDPSNYKTWGDGAIVFDPWSECYYPAAELEAKLNCSRGQGRKGKAEIYPFDPKHHTLKIQISNFYSPNEFKERAKWTYPQVSSERQTNLAADLDRFHSEKILEQKLQIAQEILTITKSSSNKCEAILASQMSRFIKIHQEGWRFCPKKPHINKPE